jgi:hypothetical protein
MTSPSLEFKVYRLLYIHGPQTSKNVLPKNSVMRTAPGRPMGLPMRILRMGELIMQML